MSVQKRSKHPALFAVHVGNLKNPLDKGPYTAISLTDLLKAFDDLLIGK